MELDITSHSTKVPMVLLKCNPASRDLKVGAGNGTPNGRVISSQSRKKFRETWIFFLGYLIGMLVLVCTTSFGRICQKCEVMETFELQMPCQPTFLAFYEHQNKVVRDGIGCLAPLSYGKPEQRSCLHQQFVGLYGGNGTCYDHTITYEMWKNIEREMIYDNETSTTNNYRIRVEMSRVYQYKCGAPDGRSMQNTYKGLLDRFVQLKSVKQVHEPVNIWERLFRFS